MLRAIVSSPSIQGIVVCFLELRPYPKEKEEGRLGGGLEATSALLKRLRYSTDNGSRLG
jgi:hypothetical protein